MLKDIIQQLKTFVNDKTAEVRKELFLVVKEWLSTFDITYLRMFDCDLVLILLCGTGDENPEITSICVDTMEFYGTNLKKLLEELKEDTSGVKFESFDAKFQKISTLP